MDAADMAATDVADMAGAAITAAVMGGAELTTDAVPTAADMVDAVTSTVDAVTSTVDAVTSAAGVGLTAAVTNRMAEATSTAVVVTGSTAVAVVASMAVVVVVSMAVADHTGAVVDMVEDTAKTLRSQRLLKKRLARCQPFFLCATMQTESRRGQDLQASGSGGQPGNSGRAELPMYWRSAMPILLV
jgi:hypothetical protein